jgi:hypothetical protein
MPLVQSRAAVMSVPLVFAFMVGVGLVFESCVSTSVLALGQRSGGQP